MSTYVKPQSPLYHKTEDAYFYPLTTADQVIMPDGTRLDAENIGSGMKMELLWENASPNSEFVAQNVSVSINPNDIICIEANDIGFMFVCVNKSAMMTASRLYGTSGYSFYCRWVNAYETYISIEQCYEYNNEAKYRVNNEACLPYRIFRIRGAET